MRIEGLEEITDNRLLARWGVLDRHPEQVNRLHEADAELVPAGDGELLAFTIDTIAEEIELGFYASPETIGWMGETVSLSDLAAVGAEPIGLLVSVTLSPDEALQDGIAAGLYVSGPLGEGGACAARALYDLPPQLFAEADFRPRARLREGVALRGLASACMDTSDGLVATLDQLLRLNGIGFHVDSAPEALLEPRALTIARRLGVPPLVLLAQHHGEFQVAFTVPEARRTVFEDHAAAAGFAPLRIGRATQARALRFGEREVDGARVRNLLDECGGDLARYVATLAEMLG